jgi:hypothetical protein
MVVSFLGGDMSTRQVYPKMNLKLRGVDYTANLIVVKSEGIDVILRMDSLSKHQGLTGYAK